MALGFLFFFFFQTQACKCVYTGLYKGVIESSDAVVTTFYSFLSTKDNVNLWRASVRTAVSGCLLPGAQIIVSTPSTSASCGATFSTTTYLITGTYNNATGENTMDVISCNYYKKLSDLTDIETSFVNNYWNECTKKCATGHTVNCFVRPCATAKCDVANAFCQDNYCNGCHAYWFTNNYDRVCQNKTQ